MHNEWSESYANSKPFPRTCSRQNFLGSTRATSGGTRAIAYNISTYACRNNADLQKKLGRRRSALWEDPCRIQIIWTTYAESNDAGMYLNNIVLNGYGWPLHLQRSAKRRGCLLSYSQAEPGRELTQPSPRLLAEPFTIAAHMPGEPPNLLSQPNLLSDQMYHPVVHALCFIRNICNFGKEAVDQGISTSQATTGWSLWSDSRLG